MTGSEIQNGRQISLIYGMSKSYRRISAKLKLKVLSMMAQTGKEYIVDTRTGSGSNRDFR